MSNSGNSSGKRCSGRRHKTNSASSSTFDEEINSNNSNNNNAGQGFEHGSWECTVCTYRNKSESFRCEICDVRKGTSTRKPRLNSTVVEQQQTVQKFVQQQQMAMIAQAHKEKRHERNSQCGNSSTHDLDSPGPSCRSLESPTPSCSSATRAARSPSAPPSSETPTPQLTCSSPVNNQLNSSMSQMSPPVLFPAPSNSAPLSPTTSGCSFSLAISAPQSSLSTPRKNHRGRKAAASFSSATIILNNNNEEDNQNHVTIQNNHHGNGRKSQLPRKNITKNFFRKNLDQNSARTLAVTVNGVTVVITDYKLLPDRSGIHQNLHTTPASTSNSAVPGPPGPLKAPRKYNKSNNPDKILAKKAAKLQQQQQKPQEKGVSKKRRRKSPNFDHVIGSASSDFQPTVAVQQNSSLAPSFEISAEREREKPEPEVGRAKQENEPKEQLKKKGFNKKMAKKSKLSNNLSTENDRNSNGDLKLRDN